MKCLIERLSLVSSLLLCFTLFSGACFIAFMGMSIYLLLASFYSMLKLDSGGDEALSEVWHLLRIFLSLICQ